MASLGTQSSRGDYHHHHDASVGVIEVVVVDERDVKQVLALVAIGQCFVAVEAQPHTAVLCHLLRC